MERKSNKPSQIERAFLILNYLKENTDKNHTIKPSDLRAAFPNIGTKDTLHSIISQLENVLNFNSDQTLKKQEEWRIVHDAFNRKYGPDDSYDTNNRITNLYYNHPFSLDEIDLLIDSILLSNQISQAEASQLITKIKNNLTNKNYRHNLTSSNKVYAPELQDSKSVHQNISIIQKAISKKCQISFYFNAYNNQKKLEPLRPTPDLISPYYVVSNSGKYYLLASKEGYKRHTMSIWRIDLMSDLCILENCPATNKDLVENLPQKWDESFHLSHLNMSYDKPVMTTLKIKQGDYTFIHDWFGDNFQCIQKTQTHDLISVYCSPYGMIHWALQYCDRVEVLKPSEVRQAIKEKIHLLKNKYQD